MPHRTAALPKHASTRAGPVRRTTFQTTGLSCARTTGTSAAKAGRITSTLHNMGHLNNGFSVAFALIAPVPLGWNTNLLADRVLQHRTV